MRRNYADRAGDESDDIDLTPMLDVVFIMLIFFIVTSTFVKESTIDLTRPNADDTPPEQSNSDPAIPIALYNNGQIVIDGTPVDLSGVQATMRRLSAERPRATVVLQVEPRVKNDTVVSVMDQSRQAGMRNITFSDQ